MVWDGGCGLLIRGSPSQLPLTEWGGLVCRPISSHTYKALPFLHGQPSMGEEMENGYLTNDYPIERYLSVEGRDQENMEDM